METLGNQKKSKKEHHFMVCDFCDFKCCKKYNFQRHLLTAKHVQETNGNTWKPNDNFINDDANLQNLEHLESTTTMQIKKSKKEQKGAKKSKKEQIFHCVQCNKEFKSRSGLWKHSKSCCNNLNLVLSHENNDIKNNENMISDNVNSKKNENHISMQLILDIIQQNQEFKQMLIEQQNKCTTINNTNNTNSNNTFNLQLFLNETCKDAMNMSDFINSIQLQLTDFVNIGETGYVNGISSVIIKNLEALDENMRPVHCSDLKRESIYIKDNNQWEKDTKDNERLKKMIKAIAHKNTKMIPKYREKYPDSQISSSKASDNYNKYVVEAMGGSGDNENDKLDKIIRRIAKEVVINK